MRYGSVCSGIESASVAWEPLGWRPSFLSEIDKNARAVLAHHYPEVPLHGDFTTIQAGDYASIDLLVGGTPCQDFSVAGKRVGLDGARGNLTLEYLRLAERLRPRWLVWENVPGVLSSNGGRDFGAFLGLLGELGYGFAWRVLDAQFVRVDGYPRAVPQRRERVFLVGYLGDWRPPAAALLEPEGMRRDTPPRRRAGEGDTGAAAFCSGGGRQGGGLDVAACLAAHGTRLDWEVETFIAEPVAPTIPSRNGAGGGMGTDFDCDGGLIAYAIQERAVSENLAAGPQGRGFQPDVAYTLEARHHSQAVAFSVRGRDGGAAAEVEPGAVSPALRAAEGGSTRPMVAIDLYNHLITGDVAATLATGGGGTNAGPSVIDGYTVRRLSVTECERLQGFPDGWTAVPNARGKPMADGPRYQMLGNSKAVNVVRWVGQRIALVDAILQRTDAA